MATIFAIHAPDPNKLEQVKEEMVRLGAPRIEVVACGDHYMALEGSHRLAAAAALGITPDLVIHEDDDVIDISRYDWYDTANWAESRYSAGDVAGELFSVQARDYWFEL